MNIAVISPQTNGNGNTTVAALLAAELSAKNKKVCLTHAKSKSDSLYLYFGFSEQKDQTNNPQQIINLIKDGGMRKDVISSYCREINSNLDLFSIDTFPADVINNVTDEQMQVVLKYISNVFPYDYIVFDVDINDMNNNNVTTILENTDCIVLVLSQSIAELHRFSLDKEKIVHAIKKIPQLVIVNKYSDIVGDLKDVANAIGINNPSKWYTLHLNEWIRCCENNGKLKYLMEQMQERNPDVIELSSDIKSLVSGITNVRRATREINRKLREESANI